MPTSSPWDGTTWDVTAPDIDQLIGNHYKEMFDLRKGVGIRIDKEHITLAGSSAGGEHVQGSARAWFQDAVPGLQPDGTALAATDNGMLWFDTDATPDNLAYVLVDHADPTVGNGWVLLSTSIFAEMVAAAHQWAAVQTFDLQTVHTLGLQTSGPIVGSIDADITINTDKFTVDAETGNTVVAGTHDVSGAQEVIGIATLGDGSVTKTSAPPTTDPMLTNKKYVDDQVVQAYCDATAIGGLSVGSKNVASVVKNSTGDYTITLTNAFASANYTTVGSLRTSTGFILCNAATDNTISVLTFNVSNAAADRAFAMIAVGAV